MTTTFEDAAGRRLGGAKEPVSKMPTIKFALHAVREAGRGVGDDNGAEPAGEGRKIVAGIAGENDFVWTESGLRGKPEKRGRLRGADRQNVEQTDVVERIDAG